MRVGTRSLARRRAGVGVLLLVSFLFGTGLASWHVASARGPSAVAVVPDDAPRTPPLSHDDQACRVCAAVVGSLLPTRVTVAVWLDDRILGCIGSQRPVTGPSLAIAGSLGSRAPPFSGLPS